jgi:hypothetical protein
MMSGQLILSGKPFNTFSMARVKILMRGSKDLYSRILGGSEKGSEGQTQLQYFYPF